MLQNELKHLQELSQSLIAYNTKEKAARIDFEEARSLIEKENTRIKDVFTSVIFATPAESIVERYIQHHQTGIIELCDSINNKLAKFSDSSAEPGSRFENRLIELLRFFISQQFDMLNYIERFFSKYFNLDAVVPDAYREIARQELWENLTRIQVMIAEKISSDGLKDCLQGYCRNFDLTSFPQGLTFRNLIYLKEFLNEVGPVINSPELPELETKLIAKLIYLNFNHLAFFSYYQSRINAEAMEAESTEQNIVIFSKSLSFIKSIPSKPGFSYHPGWPSIKEMLESWANDEIALAMLPFKNGLSISKPEQANTAEKLMLNLSVAHIACLLKLFYEETVVPSSSITDLFKFTVIHFRSKRQEKISTGSLSKEYYSVGQKTAAQVLDLLQRMITRINKNYFPAVTVACIAYYSA